jgi:hypothetical protein
MCNFVPLHRYRCQDFSCQWEGNLRTDKAKISQNAAPTPLMTVFGVILTAVALSIAAIAWFSWQDQEAARRSDQSRTAPELVTPEAVMTQASLGPSAHVMNGDVFARK